MPKVYFYDLGLRNFFLNNYELIRSRPDKGMYLENIVFREFLRKTKRIDKIKFWRTQDKKEVDFVVEKKAFEIKFNLSGITPLLSKEAKKQRYEQFKRQYPEIKFRFLTYNDILEEFYDWKLASEIK